MQRVLTLALAGIVLVAAGCGGSNKLVTKGKVIKDGKPVIAGEGEFLQVTLIPVSADGTPPANFFYAEVDQKTGVFHPSGPDKKGVPPGKYQFAVALKKDKKDKFEGAYDAERSTIVMDIDSKTPEIVIDLDKMVPGVNPTGGAGRSRSRE
jgi:hypothetical protein